MTDKPAQELTAGQALALAGLLSGSTVEQAAKAAKVDRVTVHRWMHEPLFAEEYRAGRRLVVSQATAMLQGAAAGAVEVMKTVMQDKAQAASVRLRAAQAVYDAAVKSIELDDMMQRIEALEAAYANRD